MSISHDSILEHGLIDFGMGRCFLVVDKIQGPGGIYLSLAGI